MSKPIKPKPPIAWIVLTINKACLVNNKQCLLGNLLVDKIDEFEVIKDGEVDYISLNSLYDYYELPFNKDDFKFINALKMINNNL